MTIDNDAFAQTLCTRSAHEILAQYLEHTGSREARQICQTRQRQYHDRPYFKLQVGKGVLPWVAPVGDWPLSAGMGINLYYNDLEKYREDKYWQRIQHQHDRHVGRIDPGICFQCAED